MSVETKKWLGGLLTVTASVIITLITGAVALDRTVNRIQYRQDRVDGELWGTQNDPGLMSRVKNIEIYIREHETMSKIRIGQLDSLLARQDRLDFLLADVTKSLAANTQEINRLRDVREGVRQNGERLERIEKKLGATP